MNENVDGTKQVTVKHEHAVSEPVKHGVTNGSAETTLVGPPPDEDHETVQMFATNIGGITVSFGRHLPFDPNDAHFPPKNWLWDRRFGRWVQPILPETGRSDARIQRHSQRHRFGGYGKYKRERGEDG